MSQQEDQNLRKEIRQLLNEEQVPAMPANVSATILNTILEKENARKVRFLRPRLVAASILLVIATSVAIVVLPGRSSRDSGEAIAHAEIQPGKKGALLTLADGSRISLDSVQQGVVALQGGVKAKVDNGQLVYEGRGEAEIYNTLSTPKGRQFQVTLPDGTQVWLNNASSIRYPMMFTGNDRKVSITGEVYFEVVRNERQPFLVDVEGRAEVKVLGTHFNINAYRNEDNIQATLLEGAIVVAASSSQVTLRPGQQARVLAGKPVTVVDNADLENVIAWKNGFFNFNGLSFEQVMRQLERWYDIEVIMEKGISDDRFGGNLSRQVPLDGILKYFDKIGIHYKLEDRKLTILH